MTLPDLHGLLAEHVGGLTLDMLRALIGRLASHKPALDGFQWRVNYTTGCNRDLADHEAPGVANPGHADNIEKQREELLKKHGLA